MSKQVEKAKQIETIILSHNKSKAAKKFRAGVTFTWKEFRNLFSEVYPQLKGITPTKTANALHYVNAYVGLNSLLAEKGMVIKSRKHCQEFHILGKGDIIWDSSTEQFVKAKSNIQAVDAKVSACYAKAANVIKYALRLKDGLTKHNAKFTTKLTANEIKRATGVITRVTAKSYGC